MAFPRCASQAPGIPRDTRRHVIPVPIISPVDMWTYSRLNTVWLAPEQRSHWLLFATLRRWWPALNETPKPYRSQKSAGHVLSPQLAPLFTSLGTRTAQSRSLQLALPGPLNSLPMREDCSTPCSPSMGLLSSSLSPLTAMFWTLPLVLFSRPLIILSFLEFCCLFLRFSVVSRWFLLPFNPRDLEFGSQLYY